jgi:hypothetical protein
VSFDPHQAARARDAGARSLRRYTITAAVAAAALAGGVTAIASSNPARHATTGRARQPAAAQQPSQSQSQSQGDWSQIYGDPGTSQDGQQPVYQDPQQGQAPAQAPQQGFGTPSSGTS